MSDFKAKMHQIICRLGLRPRPRRESLQHSPRPPSWILGGLLRRGGEGTREEGRAGEGRKGQEGEKGRGWMGWRMWAGRRQGRPPKLKLGPQNYFPGAGAVESAYWTSY